jgi:hypothetical protein
MKSLWIVAGLLLAGCPIAADNYGVDAGDAGSTGDAGVTTPTDAGAPTGTIACSISAEDGLNDMYSGIAGSWSGSDLIDSEAATNDSVTYDVIIDGSNSISGTLSIELDGLVVNTTTGYTVGSMAFSPGSNLPIADSWTCGAGGDCGADVTVSSFDGQTVIGSFTVQFAAGSSGTGASTCSLSSGVFNVTIPSQ